MIEILRYHLKPGSQAVFWATMINESAPLHRNCGIEIVFHGPTDGDPDGYVLARKFADEAQADEVLQVFYASAAWRNGPRESLVDAIVKAERVLVRVGREIGIG